MLARPHVLFAAEYGKSKGQFYPPVEVSRVLAKAVGIGPDTRQDHTIYDSTCGSGSVFLKVTTKPPLDILPQKQEKDNANPNAVFDAFFDPLKRFVGSTLAVQLARGVPRNRQQDITMASYLADSNASPPMPPSSQLARCKRLVCPLTRSPSGRKRASPALISSWLPSLRRSKHHRRGGVLLSYHRRSMQPAPRALLIAP
jgi:hypothetical protein